MHSIFFACVIKISAIIQERGVKKMGLLNDFLSRASGPIASTFDKYSRDPRLSDEKRRELRDKADMWRNGLRGRSDSDD